MLYRVLTLALIGAMGLPAAGSIPIVAGEYVCKEVDGKDVCVIVATVDDASGSAGSAARVVCTSWVPWLPPSDQNAPDPDQAVEIRNGIEWDLYSRVCDGGVAQYRKFPQVTGRDLAQAAHDSVVKLVPQPELDIGRPADELIVNLSTAIGVVPVQPVSATATVPGRSATVTATPARIDVVTGSHVAGDVQRLSCAPWGGVGSACTWTPVYPSVFKVTGTNDHRHHGSVSIVWDVAWTSTDGETGDLGELTTTLPVQFAVREIQIIGG